MTDSSLDVRVGLDAVEVLIGGVDLPADRLGSFRITHGRTAPTGPPEPGVCVLTCRTDALPALPRLGAEVIVRLGPDAMSWAGLTTTDQQDRARHRFVGHVTDLTARPGRTPDEPGTLTVTASTRRARLGRTYVGDTPWDAELDGARAARILTLAADVSPFPVGASDPGTVTVQARDVDRRTALDLLEELSLHTGGVLAELRDGTLLWHDAARRQGKTSAVELTAANVLRDGGDVAAMRVRTLVNDATVRYGPPLPAPDGGPGDPASVRRSDPTSVTAYGPFQLSITTNLLHEADAAAYAYRAVAAGSLPRWDHGGLTVELLRSVTTEQRGALLMLEFADIVSVAGLPDSGPFRRARLWVEGWTETVTRHGWELSILAGDYGRGAPSPRWADVGGSTRWADVDPAVTWWNAAAWDFGEDDPGRWLDRPARQRWTDVSPDITWADLPTGA